MLESIRHYAVRGVSVAGGAIVFVLTLPVVFAAMVIMMFAGIIALANIRYRLRQEGFFRQGQSTDESGTFTNKGAQKPPIEGSYKVVQD